MHVPPCHSHGNTPRWFPFSLGIKPSLPVCGPFLPPSSVSPPNFASSPSDPSSIVSLCVFALPVLYLARSPAPFFPSLPCKTYSYASPSEQPFWDPLYRAAGLPHVPMVPTHASVPTVTTSCPYCIFTFLSLLLDWALGEVRDFLALGAG